MPGHTQTCPPDTTRVREQPRKSTGKKLKLKFRRKLEKLLTRIENLGKISEENLETIKEFGVGIGNYSLEVGISQDKSKSQNTSNMDYQNISGG